AKVGDSVTLVVDLSEPAYFYVLEFNFDGKYRLIWPVDENGKSSEAVKPPRQMSLRWPQSDTRRLYLNDNEMGGLQAYAVVASKGPLPSFAEYRQRLGGLGWRVLPAGNTIWEADAKGAYAWADGLAPDRGEEREVAGAPPLDELCRALGGGSE